MGLLGTTEMEIIFYSGGLNDNTLDAGFQHQMFEKIPMLPYV